MAKQNGKYSVKLKPYFCRRCGARRFSREAARDAHEKYCKAPFAGVPKGEQAPVAMQADQKITPAESVVEKEIQPDVADLKKQFEESTGLEMPAPEMIEILIADFYDKLANKLQDESIRLKEKDARIAGKAVKVLLDYYIPKFGARPVGLALFVLLVELGPSTLAATECIVRKLHEAKQRRKGRETNPDDLRAREVREDDVTASASK